MQDFLKTIFIVAMVAGLGFSARSFAESAPVYDADTLQQQFESSGDQGENLPPPPQPPSEQERAFVPTTPQPSQQTVEPQAATQASPQPTLTLAQRVSQIEQQIDNLQLSGSSTRMDALQKEIQSLQSQVEQLNHQFQQVQSQQKSMYSDLEKKLQSTSAVKTSSSNFVGDDTIPSHQSTAPRKTNKTTVDTNSNSVTEDQPNVLEEQQVYQTAYHLIKAKKYNEAINSLQSMLQKYPTGQFAANAHYWLGDLYNVMGKNDRALIEFIVVTKNYPNSPRVSDAQLKVGLIYASQSKWSEAKAAFKKVVSRYPGTASSRLANEQLKQIKQTGH